MIIAKRNKLIWIIVAFYLFAFLFGLISRFLGVYGSIISGFIYYTCLVIIMAYMVKRVEKHTFVSKGLSLHSIVKDVILGIGIFVVLVIIFYSYFFVLYGVKPNFVHLTLFETILRAIYFIWFVGFAEELIFRGYLLDRFKELLNSKIYAILLSSLLFALWHYPVSYNFGQVVFAFFFGIILSTIRVISKREVMVALVIGHGLYNFFPFLVGYFIK